MMIGSPARSHPLLHAPPWPAPDCFHYTDSPPWTSAPADWHPYDLGGAVDDDTDCSAYASALSAMSPEDGISGDRFRMFEFKVRKCSRGRSHDWTDCPYAHPGEKARRRDPRRYNYTGAACPEFRKGNCKKGDGCDFAHGVFECWLHPSRYRTQPCKDGVKCLRRVCFFAHSPEQLRFPAPVSPPAPASPRSIDSYDGSPLRRAMEAKLRPTSPPTESSPPENRHGVTLGELVASLRSLQIAKTNANNLSPTGGAWSSPFGSPRVPSVGGGRSYSLPATPIGGPAKRGVGYFWEEVGEEVAMERVESGRGLRERMFQKLTRENSLGPSSSVNGGDDCR